MKLWLSRQHDGRYMVTGLKPIVSPIARTERSCVYARPGDPIIIRHLCEDMVNSMLEGINIERLKSTRVEITARALSGEVS